METLLQRADRTRAQQRSTKNKLYALHAPEAECIAEGKARNPYEFGVKVSRVLTHKQGPIDGIRIPGVGSESKPPLGINNQQQTTVRAAVQTQYRNALFLFNLERKRFQK